MDDMLGFDLMDDMELKLDKVMLALQWAGNHIQKSFNNAVLKMFNRELERTKKQVTATGVAAKRAVMGFDQLNRLSKQGSGKAEAPGLVEQMAQKATSAQLSLNTTFSQVAQKIRETVLAVQELGDSLGGTAQKSDEALLSSVSRWTQLPSQLAQAVTQPVKTLFQDLWGQVSTAAGASLSQVQQKFSAVPKQLEADFAAPTRQAAQALWDSLKTGSQTAWQAVEQSFGGAASYFGSTFSDAWSQVQQVFSQKGQVFQGVQGGILSSFKGVVNSLIDGINQVVCVPFQGLNGILNTLSLLSILGLKPFSWLSWRAPLPQIPHLAKGAVLPANQPFLAMVGDQRHGTNIEAPLATIQEAVAAVMEDLSQGNLAGHQATVATLQQILEAVLGISIGDEQIGAANARYQRRVQLVTGGIV